jgi:hypothetical protein
MSPARRSLEIDVRWIFSRALLAVFMLVQFVLWQRLGRMPLRAMRHRGLWFAPVVVLTFRALVLAVLLAGLFTLLCFLMVRIVLRPLLSFWLTPLVDPSWGLFHLAADEKIIASVPARRNAGWGWRPGALMLTNRRIWFFPSAWDNEPWALERDEVDRCETELPGWADFVPIRNWPEHVLLRARDGAAWSFAVADPVAVLAWFASAPKRGGAGVSQSGVREGALDA